MPKQPMPRRLKVGARPYIVKTQRNLTIHASDAVYVQEEWVHEDMLQLRGMHDAEELVIVLESGMPLALTQETYLHEALHAVVKSAYLNDLLIEGQAEEALVKRLTPAMLQLLQDNPKFVSFLTGRRSVTW